MVVLTAADGERRPARLQAEGLDEEVGRWCSGKGYAIAGRGKSQSGLCGVDQGKASTRGVNARSLR